MNQSNDIIIQAQGIREEIIRNRRWFHSHPELGYEEVETSTFLKNYLTDLGLEVKTGIAKTGIIALLKGDLPGNTILLRADIDALPIMENAESDFKSTYDGRMHACGHDTHMAILLGAVRLLVNNKSKLKGTVKFVFQPAEEPATGALAMLAEGVMKNPDVDIAAALHIISDIRSGTIELKEGVMMASTDMFEISILGKGGHGSNPQDTIDPIITGAQLVTAIQTIVSRRISPIEGAVVSIGQFIAGSASNIIPQSAYLSGTIRGFDESVRTMILEQLEIITKGICSSAGADYRLKINPLVPVVRNDREAFEDFARCTSDILNKNEMRFMEKPKTYSEDFSYFGKAVPSVFFLLGTKNEEKGCIYPVHSPDFKVDEEVLPLGSAIFANFCLNRR